MRILIAEDDFYSRKILTMMLESEQCYEIVAVADGLAAWQELEQGLGFNLCIFDIMMPKLDGLALTARMRADPRFKSQRVILCTALNGRETIEQASHLGVSHYIVKPYAKEHVLRQVRRVCEETPASVYFEPQTQVLARLGVGGTQLRMFLGDLHRDVRDFSAALASGAAQDVVQANALKGAAINLGARALALRLAKVETMLAGTPADLSAALPALDAEVERLGHWLGLDRAETAAAVAPAPAVATQAETEPAEAATVIAAPAPAAP